MQYTVKYSVHPVHMMHSEHLGSDISLCSALCTHFSRWNIIPNIIVSSVRTSSAPHHQLHSCMRDDNTAPWLLAWLSDGCISDLKLGYKMKYDSSFRVGLGKTSVEAKSGDTNWYKSFARCPFCAHDALRAPNTQVQKFRSVGRCTHFSRRNMIPHIV